MPVKIYTIENKAKYIKQVIIPFIFIYKTNHIYTKKYIFWYMTIPKALNMNIIIYVLRNT